jgi:hypothetical protein
MDRATATGAPLLRLDGSAPLDENDRRTDAFLDGLSTRSVV